MELSREEKEIRSITNKKIDLLPFPKQVFLSIVTVYVYKTVHIETVLTKYRSDYLILSKVDPSFGEETYAKSLALRLLCSLGLYSFVLAAMAYRQHGLLLETYFANLRGASKGVLTRGKAKSDVVYYKAKSRKGKTLPHIDMGDVVFAKPPEGEWRKEIDCSDVIYLSRTKAPKGAYFRK